MLGHADQVFDKILAAIVEKSFGCAHAARFACGEDCDGEHVLIVRKSRRLRESGGFAEGSLRIAPHGD